MVVYAKTAGDISPEAAFYCHLYISALNIPVSKVLLRQNVIDFVIQSFISTSICSCSECEMVLLQKYSSSFINCMFSGKL